MASLSVRTIFLLFLCWSYFHQFEAQSISNVSREEGNEITLSCDLTGTFTLPSWRGPPNLMTYTNLGDPNINPAVSRLQYAINQKDLILSDAQTTDSGDYKCSYTALGDHTVTLTVTTAQTTTTSTSTNLTTTSTTSSTMTTTTSPSTSPSTTPTPITTPSTTPSTTTRTKPTTTPSASSLSDEMIVVIVIVPVCVIALVGIVIFFYRQQMGKRKPASDKRHKRGKHYNGNMRPVQQHQQQPYILYGRHHTGESINKDFKRSRSFHNDDRYYWYDGSQVKQNPVYKGDRNLDRLYYNETLPRHDDYWSGYTTGHVYPSHTRGYHHRPDYHGDNRGHGNRQHSSYPVYSRQQEYINPSYSYMGY